MLNIIFLWLIKMISIYWSLFKGFWTYLGQLYSIIIRNVFISKYTCNFFIPVKNFLLLIVNLLISKQFIIVLKYLQNLWICLIIKENLYLINQIFFWYNSIKLLILENSQFKYIFEIYLRRQLFCQCTILWLISSYLIYQLTDRQCSLDSVFFLKKTKDIAQHILYFL